MKSCKCLEAAVFGEVEVGGGGGTENQADNARSYGGPQGNQFHFIRTQYTQTNNAGENHRDRETDRELAPGER